MINVNLTADDYTVVSAKINGIDSSGMACPPPQGFVLGHIPKEHLSVTAHACESRVVLRHRYVEDLVAMSGVGLHETSRIRFRKACRAMLCSGASFA